MKIVWQEWSDVPDPSSFGHGVPFFDRERVRDHDLVGFVEGYTWLHENPDKVVVQCIKPDAVTTPRTLNAMKKKVESLLLAKKVPCGMITHRIEAVPNS